MVNSDNSMSYSAAGFDAMVHKTLPYYETFHQETINLIKAMDLEPKCWLDTGCGTGTFAQKAVTAFPKTNFVLADPSKDMLSAAKRKLANIESERLRFLEPIATQNLIENNEKFDVITAIQAHHYLSPDERVKATKACFKLLNSSGTFVTFENIRPMTKEGVTVGKKYWGQFQLTQGRDKATVDAHLERFGVGYFPITIEEHLSLLRKTGFTAVEILWFSYMQAGFYCIK
jgi:tRNA (cmo5U34)-methyltransferase